jgi:hypothetical protein
MPTAIPVIAGHSHATALGVPIVSPDGATRLVEIDGDCRFAALTGAFPRTDDYWSQLVALSAERTIAICWNGNQHLAAFLVTTPPFDFALRARPDLPVDPTARVLPELLVRELLGQSIVTFARLLSSIAEAGGHPPVVVGTPPPKGDLAWVRKRLATEIHFVRMAEQAGSSIETVELSSPLVWLKSWIVIQQLLREVADAFALRFCGAPEEARTPDGYLREEYWSSDVTHANDAYGALMRRQLARLIDAPL